MDEIARVAGVPRSTIHRRWRSRQALEVAAVRHFLETLAPVPDTGTIRGDLVAMVAGGTAIFESRLGRRIVHLAIGLLNTLDDVDGDAEELGLLSAISEVAAELRDQNRTVVARAVARGELPADVDADLLLTLVFSPVWTRRVHRGTPRPSVEAMVDWVLRGAVAVR